MGCCEALPSAASGKIPAPNEFPSFETREVSWLLLEFELVFVFRFVVVFLCGIGDRSPREVSWAGTDVKELPFTNKPGPFS